MNNATDGQAGFLHFTTSGAETDLREWSAFARNAPMAGWGQLSAIGASYAEYGASVFATIGRDPDQQIRCGALILVFQPLPIPLRFAACLGGPVASKAQLVPLMAHIRSWGTRRLLSHIMFSPATPTVDGWEDLHLRPGSTFAPVRYPLQSLTLDVQRSDEDLLKSFRSGTRRDVRYALKAVQTVERVTTLETTEKIASWIHDMHLRQGVPVRSRTAFIQLATQLITRGEGSVFVVRQDEAIVAAGVFAIAGKTLWYLSGAVERDIAGGYPAHRLHFHVMTFARTLGLERYDFTSRSVPSVYAFKRGFRPTEYDTAGEFEMPIVPPLYAALKVVAPWANRHRRTLGGWLSRLSGR